jgi:diguanylate cyclase (GGDEF)-like protein
MHRSTGLPIRLGPRVKSSRKVELLIGRNPIKLLLTAAILLTAVLTLAWLALPRGLAMVACSDLIGALLMFAALLAFAILGRSSNGRMRWFWLLQAAGWGLWLGDQLVWIIFDLILQKKFPPMYPADALLFLAGAPMMAGLLLRPHREASERSTRLGVLDFLLLALWWLYLYVSFVVCWQYVSPNLDAYNRNFDLLSGAETVLLAAVLAVFWFQSSGRWKVFYGAFLGAVVFNGITFFALNYAIEKDVYYTGSWYDIPYSVSFAIFTAVAVLGQGLSPSPETPAGETYNSWMANLAMIAVLSLPVIAFYALLDPSLPPQAAHFRVLVTLATMFLMAFLLFIQHRRLNRELRRTNWVLQEASLTDPLTGLRNRRYFSESIAADVSQALRAYADSHDIHTRDLVFYLIDADNFKDVNDRYGHDIGDKVLVEMAHRLSSSIRHSDVLVRWGGEEFLIVSRYTDRADAELLAQRVLSTVADTPFTLGKTGETISRTCSMGWAAFPWFPDDPGAASYEEVLTIADRGLHQAKQAGRNRAIGMRPAHGKRTPASPRENSIGLQVEMLAVTGPASATASRE